MFEMVLSKFLGDMSKKLKQKSLYFELKHHIECNNTFFKKISANNKGTGKMHALVQLAHKYNCPIAVPSKEIGYRIDKFSRTQFKKSVGIVVCDSDRSFFGRRFNTILCEEGIDPNLIRDFLVPYSKCVVGYSSQVEESINAKERTGEILK